MYANSLNITKKQETDSLGDFYSLIIHDFKDYLSSLCDLDLEKKAMFELIEKTILTNKVL
jgi:hypothetical protein